MSFEAFREGFNETDFLTEPFLAYTNIGIGNYTQFQRKIFDVKNFNTQVEFQIDSLDSLNTQAEIKIDYFKEINTQVEYKIYDNLYLNTQVESQIDSIYGYNTQFQSDIFYFKELNTQLERKLDLFEGLQSQVELTIQELKGYQTQIELEIKDSLNLNTSIKKAIIDYIENLNTQVQMEISNLELINTQTRISNILYAYCGTGEDDFLTDDFLTEPFLQDIDQLCGHIRTQFRRSLNVYKNIHTQVQMQIDTLDTWNTQVLQEIETTLAFRTQVDRAKVEFYNTQILVVLYNTNKPRVLMEFPSRGITGENWFSNSTEPGDFSINNINNDIEEFYWRSAQGFVNGIILTCDTETPQGVYVDTFYMGGHNLTRGAVVVVEGSNDNFLSIPFEQNLIIADNKIIWVSPDLPIKAYKKYRVRISDPANPDGFIKVGTIIFGTSVILNKTCMADEITVSETEFKNSFKTEGFTSIANSRALKKSISLSFPNIEYESGDYNKLKSISEFARTTLKCLWIPDPRNDSLMRRFAVFGKIKEIPVETHKVKGSSDKMDHIDMNFEIDEAE